MPYIILLENKQVRRARVISIKLALTLTLLC